MPTSFESLHNETRPLALLDEEREPRPLPWGYALCAVLALLVPVIAAFAL